MKPVYATVSSKGQLVIPSQIREELGIEAGTRVAIRVDGTKVVVEPDTIAVRLQRISAMRGITAAGPSLCDELLEERQKERDREHKEGW